MTPSQPWTTLFTLDPGYQGDLTWRDARVAVLTQDEAFVVSSPNVEWVPEPVLGQVTVSRRVDGFFGTEDPVHHPQLFCSSMPWLSVIPTIPTNVLDASVVMWKAMRFHDFKLTIPGSKLGVLSSSFRDSLEQVLQHLLKRLEVFRDETNPHHTSMKVALRYSSHALQAFERLHSPATYRETVLKVALVQRFYMYLTANLSWFVVVATEEENLPIASRALTNTQYIGAMCTREQDVQILYRRGVPVWHVQPVNRVSNGQILLSPLANFTPTSAVTDYFQPLSNPCFSGAAGPGHLAAIFNHSQACADDGGLGIPFELQVTQRKRPELIPSSVHRRKTSAPRSSPYSVPKSMPRASRDKFRDPAHKWMPASIPAWAEALLNIDRSSAISRTDMWRYWFPEPALLLGPLDSDRLGRYICNWTRIRGAWLYAQRRRYVDLECPSLKPQEWREILNVSDRTKKEAASGIHNRTQLRKCKTLQLLATTCGITDIDTFLSASPVWFCRDLSQTLDHDARHVMWELFDLGFRAELLQLDRYLRPLSLGHSYAKERERERELARVFPDGSILDRASLPRASDGLGSNDAHERASSLEALRKILVGWPNPPACLQEPDVNRFSDPASLRTFEVQVAEFYAQSFFDAAGRPPILPHFYSSS